MSDKNPVDSISFFDDWNSRETKHIGKESVGGLLPAKFEETFLRVYCRDPSKVPLAMEAFSRWQKSSMVRLTESYLSTPASVRPPGRRPTPPPEDENRF